MPPTDVNQAVKIEFRGRFGGGGVKIDVNGEVMFFENSKKNIFLGGGGGRRVGVGSGWGGGGVRVNVNGEVFVKIPKINGGTGRGKVFVKIQQKKWGGGRVGGSGWGSGWI